MQRIPLFFAAALLFAGSITTAQAATVTRSTAVDGLQQVPSNGSTATGIASLTLDTLTGAYDFTLDVIGIDAFQINAAIAGGLHLHEAPAGVSGPIVVNLASDRTGLTVPAIGAFTFTAAGTVPDLATFLPAFDAGDIYLNVHTEAFPGGEIRGQFPPVPLPAGAVLMISGLVGLLTFRRARA
jgi:hypothetical protein